MQAELEELSASRQRREQLEEKLTLQQLAKSIRSLEATQEVMKAREAAVGCLAACSQIDKGP